MTLARVDIGNGFSVDRKTLDLWFGLYVKNRHDFYIVLIPCFPVHFQNVKWIIQLKGSRV